MKNFNWRRAAALMAVTGVTAALASGCAPAGTDPAAGGDDSDAPYEILMITTMTGALGVYGSGVAHGAQAAVDVLNEKGGILGRDVELTISDMAGDPTKGVTLMQESLASGKKPDMAFLGLLSADALAMAPIATQNEIISFTYTPTAKLLQDTAQYPYTFSVSSSTADAAAVPADAAYRDGARTMVTIASNSESGDDYAGSVKDRFEEIGGKVVEQIKTDPASTDFTADFERAYAANPDAIYVYPQGQPVLALNANYAAGATIPLYSESSFAHDFRAQGVSDAALENATGSAAPLRLTTPDRRSEEQNIFMDAWQALKPAQTESSQNAAAGYDAVMVTAAAANQAGSAKAADVAEALENLEGTKTWASGNPLIYSEDDHHVLASDNPDDSPPTAAFSLSTLFVTEDGGYFDYDGPLTNEGIDAE